MSFLSNLFVAILMFLFFFNKMSIIKTIRRCLFFLYSTLSLDVVIDVCILIEEVFMVPESINTDRKEDIIDLYNNLKIGLEDVEKGNIRPFSELLSEIKNRRQEES